MKKTRHWTAAAAFAAMQMTWAQMMLVVSLGVTPALLPTHSDGQMYLSAIVFALTILLTFKACKQDLDSRNLLRLCLMMIQGLPGLIVTLKLAGWANRDPHLAPAIFGWPLAGLFAATFIIWLALTAANHWRPRPTATD